MHKMSSEVSVSKGVFVCKNGFIRPRKHSVYKRKEKGVFANLLWYKTLNSLWKNLESKLHVINSEMFATTLKDLLKFVHSSHDQKLSEIPAAALLTGINMPDHDAQFSALTKEIKENISPHCVTLLGQDCQNMKVMVENMISGFINDEDAEVVNLYDDQQDDETKCIKKYQCNFSSLQAWYESLYMNNEISNYLGVENPKKIRIQSNRKVLVVIIPDLENFNESVLQDFILAAHSYLNILPFVLIFGVATSLQALHRALPYHVSSKTNIKVFSSQPSTVYLNNVMENVFFTENCPFSLSGQVFNLFTDIFLFYDLSVTGFIKNYKYAMMEHFSQGNTSALCSNENAEVILSQFTHEDFESLRKIYSFRDLVEKEVSFHKRIQLLTDDDYLKNIVAEKISAIKKYKCFLHLFIRCLHVLVKDLPKTPFGKQVRELYASITSRSITNSSQFNECFQLLKFQSKDEFSSKLKNIIGIIENNWPTNVALGQELKCIKGDLNVFLHELGTVSTSTVFMDEIAEDVQLENVYSREKFKENLKNISRSQSKNHYEKLRDEIVEFLRKLFEKYLVHYRSFHFNEIYFFNDMSIQNQLIGIHRSAIHTALNDPHTYLQCACCEIQNDGVILSTMPDISIAYKLHLEGGKMINLYDWLQAFLSILDPTGEDDDSKRRVHPELQARFTQAIVELEYLGFIKTSKRKTDHVQRLTWGG